MKGLEIIKGTFNYYLSIDSKLFALLDEYLYQTKTTELLLFLYRNEYYLNCPIDIPHLYLLDKNAIYQKIPQNTQNILRNFEENGNSNLYSKNQYYDFMNVTDNEITASYESFKLQLQNQLAETSDYALSLHIILMILFMNCNPKSILHISGKFVPSVLKLLQPYLETLIINNINVFTYLKEYQRDIIAQIKSNDRSGTLNSKLNDIQEFAKSQIE